MKSVQISRNRFLSADHSPRQRGLWFGFLCLMRPANILTAHADVLAAYAVAGAHEPVRLMALLASTTGLYGGGVVLNDAFDANLDALERPERPIPTGKTSLRAAATFGAVLLLAGVALAWACSPLSGTLALGTAVSAVIYDGLGKHHPLFGPLNMGLCRGLNWLLGLSAASRHAMDGWPAAVVVLCYIAGITSLSRGEVRGGTKTAAIISAAWLIASLVFLAAFLSIDGRSRPSALPFLALLLYRIAGPFWRAFRAPDPFRIRAAVRAGVLSLIALDAGLAAAFAGPLYGLAMLLLYIPATFLARLFAVT